MLTFKDIVPGLFRSTSMLVYCKFEKETEDGYNSVLLTSGKLCKFKDEEEVFDF